MHRPIPLTVALLTALLAVATGRHLTDSDVKGHTDQYGYGEGDFYGHVSSYRNPSGALTTYSASGKGVGTTKAYAKGKGNKGKYGYLHSDASSAYGGDATNYGDVYASNKVTDAYSTTDSGAYGRHGYGGGRSKAYGHGPAGSVYTGTTSNSYKNGYGHTKATGTVSKKGYKGAYGYSKATGISGYYGASDNYAEVDAKGKYGSVKSKSGTLTAGRGYGKSDGVGYADKKGASSDRYTDSYSDSYYGAAASHGETVAKGKGGSVGATYGETGVYGRGTATTYHAADSSKKYDTRAVSGVAHSKSVKGGYTHSQGGAVAKKDGKDYRSDGTSTHQSTSTKGKGEAYAVGHGYESGDTVAVQSSASAVSKKGGKASASSTTTADNKPKRRGF